MGIPVKITASGDTDIGSVRSTNQDSYLIDNEKMLYIVADGMGGHAGGEIASQLCIERVRTYIQNDQIFTSNMQPHHPDQRILVTLAKSINFASAKIYERALEEPSLKGMGITATVLKVIDGFAYFAHVGDSRLYLIRQGLIYQMTYDHSLVSEQVRAGLLTREEAELHHLRNVITRSVGYQEEEDVDANSFLLEDGDLILMCSDGLYGKISDREIAELTKDLENRAVRTLIGLANERGGDDNITVIILKIQVSS